MRQTMNNLMAAQNICCTTIYGQTDNYMVLLKRAAISFFLFHISTDFTKLTS